jgi:ERCC4-type nuclease
LLGAAARPLLIIESTETERVHPNAVMGAMAWITLDLGLPVLMTGGSEATARFISIAARREARILDLLSGNSRPKSLDAETTTIEAASREIRAIMEGEQSEGPLAKRWSEEVMATRCRLLAELPGIGMKTARCIMQEAGDISNLCQLSEQSLASIDGVSPQQAKELHRFLVG